MDIASLMTAFMVWSQGVVDVWGYLGLFFISVVGNASIIFPIPTHIVTFFFASILNPWLVAIISAVGAAIGEVVGYVIGRGVNKATEKKRFKWLRKAEKWTDHYGVFTVIFIFALTPLPDDIAGIISGTIKYDFKKFFLATLLGKIIMYSIIAWGGFIGINWVLTYFGG